MKTVWVFFSFSRSIHLNFDEKPTSKEDREHETTKENQNFNMMNNKNKCQTLVWFFHDGSEKKYAHDKSRLQDNSPAANLMHFIFSPDTTSRRIIKGTSIAYKKGKSVIASAREKEQRDWIVNQLDWNCKSPSAECLR